MSSTIDVTVKGKLISEWESFFMSFNVPPLVVKTNFFRLLAVSQKVGLGLRESLTSLSKSEPNVAMKSIIDDMIAQVSKGTNLADTMSKHNYFFLSTEIELIRAAQGMGNMPETLEEISNELENYAKIKSKIKGALMYPITLLIFAAIAITILLIKVIPTIVSLFPDQNKLPEITKITLSLSAFLIEWWYVIFFVVGGIVIGYNLLYKYFLPFKISIDSMMLKIPVVSDAIKTFYMYRFSKLLGDFLYAGVNQIDAMQQISKIFDNFLYKQKAENIKADLSAGFTFVDTIEGSTLFDPILVQIIVVGEQTGNLGEILKTMALFYKEQLLQKISLVMGFIEPILMGLIAVLIGSIVASIFLPLADLVNVIT